MNSTQIGFGKFSLALQRIHSSSAGSYFICLSSPLGSYINKRVHKRITNRKSKLYNLTILSHITIAHIVLTKHISFNLYMANFAQMCISLLIILYFS